MRHKCGLPAAHGYGAFRKGDTDDPTQNHCPQSDLYPKLALPLPERLIEGAPEFHTWAMDEAKDGTVHSGVWQAKPRLTHSIKGETFEFCHILEGVISLTENGQLPVMYRAGDSFVMKPGFVGTWRTNE